MRRPRSARLLVKGYATSILTPGAAVVTCAICSGSTTCAVVRVWSGWPAEKPPTSDGKAGAGFGRHPQQSAGARPPASMSGAREQVGAGCCTLYLLVRYPIGNGALRGCEETLP